MLFVSWKTFETLKFFLIDLCGKLYVRLFFEKEFDGSDSGARPDEAISWGKIRIDAMPVKVYSEASIVFPMIVAETFAKYYHDHMHAEEQNK